jgi:hypothetical protein
MPDHHWKRRERQAAALFGASRQRCSGSSGRPDCSRSDSTHATLFVETKTRARCSTRTLYDATRDLARREGRTAVLMLAQKGRPGFLVVCHADDLAAVAREYLSAAPPADGPAVPLA